MAWIGIQSAAYIWWERDSFLRGEVDKGIAVDADNGWENSNECDSDCRKTEYGIWTWRSEQKKHI